MKGFKERTNGTGKFFVIKHNSICEESSKEKPGFAPVEVMNPRSHEVTIKFIKKYDALEAMVTKIEWRDTGDKYEQRYMSWKIYLDTGEDKGVLEFPFESRVSSRFMKLAENLDFTKPVEFRAWRGNDDKTAFIVRQDEQSIPQKYTKENPGECPPPKEKLGGKWNFDDQMLFLHERMMNVVIPRVEAARVMAAESNGDGESEQQPVGHEPSGDPEYPYEEDDIPF